MVPDAGLNYEGQDLEALTDIPGYYRWIVESFGAALTGHVLEVGAGVGNFARAWIQVPGVRSATLVEPADNLFPVLQANFVGHPRVQTVHGTLAAARSLSRAAGGIANEVYDAALLVNVLEHLSDDRGMLCDLRDTVRPGGAVLVFTPALPWLYGTLDRRVGHVRRYTETTLRACVSAAGLTITSLRYFDGLGVLPWFIVGRVLKVNDFDAAAARAYDRFVVPWLPKLERLVPPMVGKNLVCVARRPMKDPA